MTVYVLSTDHSGAYKIGHTSDWTRRLRSYRDHAFEIKVHFLDHEAGPEVEAQLHRLFRHKQAPRPDARTEWFLLDGDDFDTIREILNDVRSEVEAKMRALVDEQLRSMGLLDDPP